MELEAACPFCGKVSRTTDSRTSWTSGCGHARGRYTHGTGPIKPTDDATFWFDMIKSSPVKGTPVTPQQTK
jgi:hypothetical protein